MRKQASLVGAVIFVLALLGPLAQLFRTQQPWNCFPLTWDESYFLQAIHNWANGAGFRLHGEDKPFGPGITIGLPMAWGPTLVHKLARLDWPQAGRLWVYLNSAALFLSVGWAARRRAGAWSAAVIAMAVFSACVSRSEGAPYLIYGILGEMPGLLAVFVSMLLLNRGSFSLAGLFAALAFVSKPSFVFWVPSMGIAALLASRRGGLKTIVASAFVLLLSWSWIAGHRGESIPQYLRHFAEVSRSISLPNPNESLWAHLRTLSLPMLAVLVAGIALGFRRLLPGDRATWVHLIFGILYYVVQGARPVPKQWFVFFGPAAIFVSLQVAKWISNRLNRAVELEAAVKPVLFTAVLVWAINVPPLARRDFTQTPVMGCPVKEQRELDRALLAFKNSGKLTRENLAAVSEFSSSLFLYELGWNPTYAGSWEALGKPTRHVVGDLATLLPAPQGCTPRWQGSYLAWVECPH